MTELRIGYVPLTDAAVVIVAAERGFAARHGLRLVLEREPSWATLRDKLLLGIVDAAHLLAPLAVATAIGLSPGGPVPLVSPFCLGLNGNAVTVSSALWAALAAEGPTDGPAAVASSLGRALRRRGPDRPATFATVFPFSFHTYQLRAFLQLGGLDPDRDVRIMVVPPPYMVEALATGAVDGFCVGSPWNSLAVEAGIGRIAVLGSGLMPDVQEKLLAYPAGRIAAPVADALVAALAAAAAWCADPAHRSELAALLGDDRHLGLDPAIVRRTLDGRLLADRDGTLLVDPAYLRFGGALHRPDPGQASRVLGMMREAGQLLAAGDEARAAARAVYDPAPFGRSASLSAA